jgi:hypothetical protein
MESIIASKVDADGGGTLKPPDEIKLIETVANCGFESHNRRHIEIHLYAMKVKSATGRRPV